MADVLPFKAPPGGRVDQSLKAARAKARPYHEAWLKRINAGIAARQLSEIDGRLAREMLNYPSAHEGRCWAGQDRLAAKLGVTDRTIQRAIFRLRKAGLLASARREWRRGRCYLFLFNGKPLFPPSDDRTKSGGRGSTRLPVSGSFDPTKLSGHHTTKLSGQMAFDPTKLSGEFAAMEPKPPVTSMACSDAAAPESFLLTDSFERESPPIPQMPDHGEPIDPTDDMRSGETASGLPRGGADAARSVFPTEILPPDTITFGEFWRASGEVGKKGPAIGEWKKLSDADRAAVGAVVIREGSIDTGGVWSCNWLAGRGWEWPPPTQAGSDRHGVTDALDFLRRPATPLPPSIEQLAEQALANGVPTLRPYSDEWWTARKRYLARGESVFIMDEWAQSGKGWPVINGG